MTSLEPISTNRTVSALSSGPTKLGARRDEAHVQGAAVSSPPTKELLAAGKPLIFGINIAAPKAFGAELASNRRTGDRRSLTSRSSRLAAASNLWQRTRF